MARALQVSGMLPWPSRLHAIPQEPRASHSALGGATAAPTGCEAKALGQDERVVGWATVRGPKKVEELLDLAGPLLVGRHDAVPGLPHLQVVQVALAASTMATRARCLGLQRGRARAATMIGQETAATRRWQWLAVRRGHESAGGSDLRQVSLTSLPRRIGPSALTQLFVVRVNISITECTASASVGISPKFSVVAFRATAASSGFMWSLFTCELERGSSTAQA